MYVRTRLLLIALVTTTSAGCYESHSITDPLLCGAEVCNTFEQCCLDCDGGGRCTTLDLPCAPISCGACSRTADCTPAQYCRFEVGICGGSGTCEPRPDGCFTDCPLICGCDGETYCNECGAALTGGVSVSHEGACEGERCGDSVVCGRGERCCLLCDRDGMCVGEREPCPDIDCPGECYSAADCGAGLVCIFAPETCSGPGFCVPTPAGCDDDCPGVCGCDGMLHCNECYALSAGVSVAPPEMCEIVAPCGRGGRTCAASEYCDLGPSCGALDTPSCRERPTVCPDVEAPVCGCDGVTYGNECVAAGAGATVASWGACGGCPDGECGHRTCGEIQRADPTAPSGVYSLQSADGGTFFDVFCDMDTDGGGWTLVASTRRTTLNDEASAYYADLATTMPRGGHTGIWNGLRSVVGPRTDVRFTCRSPRAMALEVDLSFYDVGWYVEWTRGTDAESCFSEGDGTGFELPAPARRDNVGGTFLPIGSRWMSGGYLEGEDACEDDGDFTVDLNDRGMDSNESDGTDWGEDDGSPKCGSRALTDGLWHVWVRER